MSTQSRTLKRCLQHDTSPPIPTSKRRTVGLNCNTGDSSKGFDEKVDSSTVRSSSVLGELSIYEPQDQLVVSYRGRLCAYDKSMDKRGNESNNDDQRPATRNGSVHRMTYNPLSYVPSTHEVSKIQTIPAFLPPKPPIQEQSNLIAPSKIEAKPPPSGRPVTSASPRNPYLKSNRGNTEAAGTNVQKLSTSSSSNPSKKKITTPGERTSPTNSKPHINRPLSKSSPRNPCLKASTTTAATTKPACARPILAASPINPYLKSRNTQQSLTSSTATMQERNTGNASTPVNKYTESQAGDLTAKSNDATSGHLSRKKLFPPYQKDRTPDSIQVESSKIAQSKPQSIPQAANEHNHSQNDSRLVVIDPPATASNKEAVKSTKAIVIDDPPKAAVGSTTDSISNSSEACGAIQDPSHASQAVMKMKKQSQTASVSGIASVRPASWASCNASNVSAGRSTVTPSTSARPEFPGEVHLPPELVYDPSSIKPIKDEYRNKLTTNALLDQPLLNGWKLYRHQKRAILKGLMKRRVILALDMGLGKTLIGCVWSKAFKESYEALKIFVICPVTIKKEWRRTAEKATGLQVDEENNPPKDSLDLSIHSWAKIPSKIDPAVQHFVTVFDEAHAMQAMESNRTQAALKLVFDKRCVGVLLLTGTPMKNGKPRNLFPLLKAVRHPLGKHQKAYERHFCQGRLASFGRGQQWIASGSSNLKQLHRMIESNLLHMTKDEYLRDLPPLTRETRNVPISPRCQRSYHEAVRRLATLKEAMKTNKDLNSNALLGSTQDLRVICAFAKIRATVELAKEILKEEPAVAIFTNFAKAALAIHKQLADAQWNGALLTGETPANKRQALIDGFQNEIYPAFISTFGAGGVGITLTQARTIIFLDRPWTPGELLQAEDRIRRIGQEHKTRSIWMSAFEFDRQLDTMLEEKNQATKAVLTKVGTLNGDAAAASINVPKLVASLISKSSDIMV